MRSTRRGYTGWAIAVLSLALAPCCARPPEAAPGGEPPGLTAAGFRALLQRLARAWSEQDTDAALSCFTEDAIYMEPPDEQLFQGHGELRPYFAALEPGTFMTFHQIWFDEARQTGAGEFSFGAAGKPEADHGVAVVEVRNGRIAFWREYFEKGPAEFETFLSREEKNWKWTIRNYP